MANRGGRHGEIVGAVGTPPPPGAPVQQAQPLTPQAVAAMADKAAANAKELPAFSPKLPAGGPDSAAQQARAKDVQIARGRLRPAMSVSAQTTPSNAAVGVPPAGTIILTDADATVGSPPATMTVHPQDMKPETRAAIAELGKAVLIEQELQDAREAVEAAGNAAADVAAVPPAPAVADAADLGLPDAPAVAELPTLPPSTEPPPRVEGKLAAAARDMMAHRLRSAQPAASNTDSPARGMPSPVADPGKRITGGFGDAIDQQYFPLDGSELRALVVGILEYLKDQMLNDLRFSVALCYPRVTARVVIHIEGYAHEMNFDLTRAAEHTKTSAAIAEAAGADAVAFELEGVVAEMTPEGESVMPPNATREALGLVVPRKQRVPMPTGGFAVIDRAAN